MKLSVVIPAHNEQDCIVDTVVALVNKLKQEHIEHEIVVVDDSSTDNTAAVLASVQSRLDTLKVVVNEPPNGFGFAIQKGLETYSGDAVAIYMADASDDPDDLVRFFRSMESENVDCVFGTRFSSESRIVDYPQFKLVLNRFANSFIKIIFGIKYNDVTNAFKLYRRHVIDGVRPILSNHFNITVELPLKALVRGYSYTVIANNWYNRKTGDSKLKIKEMGSRYMFITLYCLLEKWLSKGDYHRVESERIAGLRSKNLTD